MTQGKRDHHLSGEMELTQHTQIPTCLPMKIVYLRKVYNGLSSSSCKKIERVYVFPWFKTKRGMVEKGMSPGSWFYLGVPGCMCKEINGLPWSCSLAHGWREKWFTMVLPSGSWFKRGLVYHGSVPWDMYEERNGLPWSCPLVHGWREEWFTMVLSSGSWLKRGMVYHGPVLCFMVEERNGYHGHVLWLMVEERNGLSWSCPLAHGWR